MINKDIREEGCPRKIKTRLATKIKANRWMDAEKYHKNKKMGKKKKRKVNVEKSIKHLRSFNKNHYKQPIN